MALKLKEGVDPGYRQALEAGGGKEKDSPLGPPERSHPCQDTDFRPETSILHF